MILFIVGAVRDEVRENNERDISKKLLERKEDD